MQPTYQPLFGQTRKTNFVQNYTEKSLAPVQRSLTIEPITQQKGKADVSSQSGSFGSVFMARISETGDIQHRALPFSAVQWYSYQILLALQYLHERNICHRDIKLQNLLITDHNINTDEKEQIDDIQNEYSRQFGDLKVCDFGSAKYLKEGESSVAYICSRFYRAPELVLGATEYNCSIDMWSFGCVLGELLLGHPMFPGETSSDQFVEIVKQIGTPSINDLRAMAVNNDVINMMRYSDQNEDTGEQEQEKEGDSKDGQKEIRCQNIPAMPMELIFSEDVDKRAISLLSQVLVYNPDLRLTATQALQHPMFSFAQ
ncbi:MAG: putative Protein kinase gsk3 [Streblomastix strix]|uniref:Protein kinase domain-containing protein n=1 Tax=Streblomastix strix TaxID=222440 RepID=A0A5J4VGU1_9EUKA|nr:MAG: putative Protein kinase gsk3 [Streblomastix strix]